MSSSFALPHDTKEFSGMIGVSASSVSASVARKLYFPDVKSNACPHASTYISWPGFGFVTKRKIIAHQIVHVTLTEKMKLRVV
jgi:hypothetical protein